MAAKTRNIYITGSITGSIEIPTTNRDFSILECSIKVSKVTYTMTDNGNGKISAKNGHNAFPVVGYVAFVCGHVFELANAQNPLHTFPRNFP